MRYRPAPLFVQFAILLLALTTVRAGAVPTAAAVSAGRGERATLLDTPQHQAQEIARLDRTAPAPPSELSQATEHLWRGSVPDEGALKWLADHGFNTVIDMRVVPTSKEDLECRRLKMNYVHIPITLLAPSRQVVGRFLAVLDDPRSGKVYMHCFFGTDRVGMMLGIYRQLRQHWTATQALSELKHHDFRNWLSTFTDTVAHAQERFGNVQIDRNFARTVLAGGGGTQ